MENILALLIPVIVGIVVLRFFMKQIGCLWKIAVNSVSGFVCLWLLNLLSGITGIVFELNFFTTLVAGAFGIPGIIFLVILQFLG